MAILETINHVHNRLVVGVILHVFLSPFMSSGSRKWPGPDDALIGASLSVAAITILVPVFWQGKRWQRFAAMLLICIPSIILFFAVHLLLNE
jgi:hypothetical protein